MTVVDVCSIMFFEISIQYVSCLCVHMLSTNDIIYELVLEGYIKHVNGALFCFDNAEQSLHLLEQSSKHDDYKSRD